MELYISIIGAIVAIIVSVLGAILANKNTIIPIKSDKKVIILRYRRLRKYKFVKKYYPCGKFYFHGYENRFSCPCVSIWNNGYF